GLGHLAPHPGQRLSGVRLDRRGPDPHLDRIGGLLGHVPVTFPSASLARPLLLPPVLASAASSASSRSASRTRAAPSAGALPSSSSCTRTGSVPVPVATSPATISGVASGGTSSRVASRRRQAVRRVAAARPRARARRYSRARPSWVSAARTTTGNGSRTSPPSPRARHPRAHPTPGPPSLTP